MKKTFLLFAFIFTLSTIQSYSQSHDVSPYLTNEEKEQLKDRILDKLEDFQYFLQTMADKRNSEPVRMQAMQSNILMFIGECEPYNIFNYWTSSEEVMPAVKMQTSSANRSQKSSQKMKSYFSRIMNNKTYANIRIEQSDAVRIGNIEALGNGKYLAVAYICQRFIGYADNGSVRYGDVTEKKVKIHIDHKEIPTANGIENLWDVKLGDMYVISTQKL
ncbi:MAG: hypothetical protein K2I57_00425 [Muribaculaceae bacterium]|nr:hypothetical protein [Muribaculaceae bacterium]